MRSLFTQAGMGADEQTYWAGPTRAHRGEPVAKPLVIYCHGAGGTAAAVASGEESPLILDLASRGHVVIANDWAFDNWGGDVGTMRVKYAVDYARANLGCSGPVVMVGASMGFLTMANFARRWPAEVAAIAGIIPCTDLQGAITAGGGPSVFPTVAAVYPPAYNDATHGQTYNPIHMVANGLLDPSIPIKLWSLPSDTLTTPAHHAAFVAARPQTEMVDIVGAGVYHGAIAVKAAQAFVVEWIEGIAA